jgi:hypothetical protein
LSREKLIDLVLSQAHLSAATQARPMDRVAMLMSSRLAEIRRRFIVAPISAFAFQGPGALSALMDEDRHHAALQVEIRETIQCELENVA